MPLPGIAPGTTPHLSWWWVVLVSIILQNTCDIWEKSISSKIHLFVTWLDLWWTYPTIGVKWVIWQIFLKGNWKWSKKYHRMWSIPPLYQFISYTYNLILDLSWIIKFPLQLKCLQNNITRFWVHALGAIMLQLLGINSVPNTNSELCALGVVKTFVL